MKPFGFIDDGLGLHRRGYEHSGFYGWEGKKNKYLINQFQLSDQLVNFSGINV